MTDTNLVYLNCSISNNGETISTALTEEQLKTPLSYSNNLTANLLKKQSDYEMSIIRLNLPSDNLDVLNITSANNSNYTICLSAQINNMTRHFPCMMPISQGSTSSDVSVYPWAYRSQNDVVEALNRSLVISS